MSYWLYIFVRTALFTGLEWLVLYHLWESFPRLRRIPRPVWFLAAGLLFVANFGFKPLKWFFYPRPGDSAAWSFLYRTYVTSYFVIGTAALLAGGFLLVHYGWVWWRRWRGSAAAERLSPNHEPMPASEVTFSRRAFLSYGVAGGLSLATAGSAYAVATSDEKDVRVRPVEIPLPPEHRALSGLRILQVTDIHVGPFLRGPELERLLRLAADQKADLIVHTGDHYNMEKEYEDEGAAPLGLLEAPHGVYAVPGNHDRYFGVERFVEIFEKSNIRVLRKESTPIEGVPGLVLHGINDPESKLPNRFAEVEELGAALDPSKFHLLLSHRPEAFHQAAARGFDLTLAGHTHGGQVHIRLPLGIDISPAKLFHPYDWGLFEREGPEKKTNRLYVCSGLGYAGPPVRAFCPPELALFEFVYRSQTA